MNTDFIRQLSDTELIAIILHQKGSTTASVHLAKKLLMRFKNIREILSHDFDTLNKSLPITLLQYNALFASIELGKRYLRIPCQQGEVLHSFTEAESFLITEFHDESQEIFACIFLNTQNRIICFERLFIGTLNETVVYPREIIKRVLRYHAKNIILTHNHPSGNIEPSQADIQLTELLKKALNYIDVDILDHIIVGDVRTYSFKAHGLL
jgi:DNA repair protein RadC